jgi:glycosyltransferase involved in cell wall biosynthesis
MRVSVIVNNYNYRDFVGRAVDSALQQSYEDMEVIVVDDGSQDGSLTILGAYGDAVSLIVKENGGQASAYGRGFERATGDIVIFLDADDWLYPSAAAEVVAVWRSGTSKVQFRLAMVNTSGESLGRYVPRSMHDRDALELLCRFGAYGSPPGSGNAFCSDFLRRIFPLDEKRWRIAADTVPILLAPMYGEIISLPLILGAYRLHRRNSEEELLTNNAPEGLWQEFARIRSTKQYIQAELVKRELPLRVPLLFAPWECRIAALCSRFGGKPIGDTAASKEQFLWFMLRSIWRWPDWGWMPKSMLSVWTVLLLTLPHGAARWLALKHRSSTGAVSG